MCVKYFPSFPQKNLSPEKTETKQVFTFQLLNDKIVQNTNFAKLPVPNVFFANFANFIIQKFKSKHLVCLSFLWCVVFMREREKIFSKHSRPNTPLVSIHGANMRLLYASRNSDNLSLKLSCEIIEENFNCDFI